jgi:antitoxin MazE
MLVSRWGNSLAVRIPAALAEALDLKEGDDITLHIHGRADVAVERRLTRDEAFEIIRGLRGDVPADFKFNRDEANAR